jgi:hypothetical protein
MSYSISTLLIRNLDDVFGEIDPARRRAAIDEIFHEDAAYHDRNGVFRGRDEIQRIAGVYRASHPELQYQQSAPPEEVGDGGRLRWVLPPFIIFSTSYPKRNVRLWHKADIQLSACNVRFRG